MGKRAGKFFQIRNVQELIGAMGVAFRPEHARDDELRLRELFLQVVDKGNRAARAESEDRLSEALLPALVNQLLQVWAEHRAAEPLADPSDGRGDFGVVGLGEFFEELGEGLSGQVLGQGGRQAERDADRGRRTKDVARVGDVGYPVNTGDVSWGIQMRLMYCLKPSSTVGWTPGRNGNFQSIDPLSSLMRQRACWYLSSGMLT